MAADRPVTDVEVVRDIMVLELFGSFRPRVSRAPILGIAEGARRGAAAFDGPLERLGFMSRSGLVFLARDVAGADWARTGGRRCGQLNHDMRTSVRQTPPPDRRASCPIRVPCTQCTRMPHPGSKFVTD